mmetsp:Transcript_28976/g.93420  ORF Transcript_28976/g.93420 Transcript_28976/m.93420 type:complete len:595 (+) Transcript_28976:76-1860(+)
MALVFFTRLLVVATTASAWLPRHVFDEANSFPGSEDPKTIEGIQEHSSNEWCRLDLIVDAVLDNYGEVVAREIDTSPCAGVSLEAVVAVIEFHGTINAGVQYDRFGALFIDDYEVMRVTTPEPNGERDIAWDATQDVTDYAKVLFTGGPRTARLAIPNVVNPTYTGVIRANVSVALYAAAAETTPAADGMVAVAPPPFEKGGNPFDHVGISSVTNSTSAANRSGSASFDFFVDRLFVDVQVSAHSNEEFWYTNLPGAQGGAYRTLVVYVDDVLAGAAPAFPFIYSGGINPLLWRPIGGIASFALPANRFDLTPFAARVSDGKKARVTLAVVSEDDPDSVWYVDATVVAWKRDTALREMSLVSSTTFPPTVKVTTSNSSRREDVYDTVGALSYYLRGVLTDDLTGEELMVEIDASSTNSLHNVLTDRGQSTLATMTNVIRTTVERTTTLPPVLSSFRGGGGGLSRLVASVRSTSVEDVYPLYVDLVLRGEQEMTNVTLARRRALVLDDRDRVNWTSALSGLATFDLVGTDYGTGATNASFDVTVAGETCYDHRASANDGAVTDEDGKDTYACILPAGLRSCGIDLCGVAALPHRR